MRHLPIRLAHGSLEMLVAAGLVAVLAVTAEAGVPTDQLRGHVDRILKVVEDPGLLKDGRAAERRGAIRKAASEVFDFEELARRALGRHWTPRTPDERREFVVLMADLLEQAYIGKIETYAGEKVQFLGDSVDGSLATVRTRIATKSGTEIPVDYRMLRRDGRWLAYDVFIEGVSLVANYRTQFDRFIQKQSYAELVKTLRAKQTEHRATGEAPRKERPAETGAPKAISAPPPATAPLPGRTQTP